MGERTRRAAMFKILFAVALVVLPTTLAGAKENCDSALVVATYSDQSSYSSDWRLATFVSREAYNELKKGMSGNAVIYGVPVGASYDEYKRNIEKLTQSHKESLTINQARQILWRGLDAGAVNAYSKCLQTEVFLNPGLHMAVVAGDKASDTVPANNEQCRAPSPVVRSRTFKAFERFLVPRLNRRYETPH
jgi:hypothetical protein